MRIFVAAILIATCLLGCGRQKEYQLTSDDQAVRLSVYLDQEKTVRYQLTYRDKSVLSESLLGVALEGADFTHGLTLVSVSPVQSISENYQLWTGKKSQVIYTAKEQLFSFVNAKQQPLTITFRVSNDGVAFRYGFPGSTDDIKHLEREMTSFSLPEQSLAWLQPMAMAQTGWKNTNPSYEEHYELGQPVGTPSPSEAGWVFPALFNVGEHWLLITESGVSGGHHASRLQQDSSKGEYKIGSPMSAEVFTDGGLLTQSVLPFYTPWRVVAVGSLARLMESTLGTDLAEPMIAMETDFIKPGIASWSWGLLKDDATIYDVQRQFIDYAAEMSWPYALVDADWDRKIGYEKMQELADYAATKKVGLLVWYNSSGAWNQTDLTPKSQLLTHAQRELEFRRLQSMGIKGVKIDFFAGDGQSMMQYYHEILQDAAQYQLLVNFHGSTLPRGWQRTYPNLMTMESVKGFEMITFSQAAADLEASHATTLPFTRNIFDPMDFTPTVFFKIPAIERKTTNGFQLALPIIFLSGIQHIVETPTGMATVPYFVKDFMSTIPSRWDDVKFIDGYPGKLTVIARRAGDVWYVAGINGEAIDKTLQLDLSFVGDRLGYQIADDALPLSFVKKPITASAQVDVVLRANGGFVMVFE